MTAQQPLPQHGQETATRRMTVLMASTSYPTDAKDWKGRFIHDMACALDGTEALNLRFWGPPGELPGTVGRATTSADARFLAELLSRGGIAHRLRNTPISGLGASVQILRRLNDGCRRAAPDLYHLNWLQLALALPLEDRPVYVTVLGTDFRLLRMPGMVKALRRSLKRRRCIIAPNARWMHPTLDQYFGDIADINPNPFGVSPDWFGVERKPPETPTWLVVSRVTRKKLGDLLAWGAGRFGAHRRLVLLGPMQEPIDLPDWVDYRGATDPTALRTRWFPNATGLLTLSRHDEGRPQVMIEAMAAGLPVVASDLPAHRDLVGDGRTGRLVVDANELHTALNDLDQPTLGERIGRQARDWTTTEIGTWDDYATRCIASYRELLDRTSGHEH
jgi:glycosyltransferase involved in cell wall biosynthesis